MPLTEKEVRAIVQLLETLIISEGEPSQRAAER